MSEPITRVAIKLPGVVILGWAAGAAAQEWPKQRPITLVVAFAPGAVTDTVARLIGQKLRREGGLRASDG